MKPTEITMQIVKNLGNYETCRLEATYTLDDKDDLTQSFVTARKQLETAFSKAYGKQSKSEPEKLKELMLTSPEFDRVCKALKDGKTELKDLEKYFIVSQEAINYLKTNKLI